MISNSEFQYVKSETIPANGFIRNNMSACTEIFEHESMQNNMCSAYRITSAQFKQ